MHLLTTKATASASWFVANSIVWPIGGPGAAFRLALFAVEGNVIRLWGETAMQPVYAYTQAGARAGTLLHQAKHARAAW
jgi:hypothetical protein